MEFAGENQNGETCLEGKREEKSRKKADWKSPESPL